MNLSFSFANRCCWREGNSTNQSVRDVPQRINWFVSNE